MHNFYAHAAVWFRFKTSSDFQKTVESFLADGNLNLSFEKNAYVFMVDDTYNCQWVEFFVINWTCLFGGCCNCT